MTTLVRPPSAIAVRQGQCVAAVNAIGRSARPGGSTGPHLHFELRLRGAAVAPRF